MVWEPASIELSPTSSGPPFTVDPAFPVEFAEPRLGQLDWGRDSIHFPVSLAPLAGDYAHVVGESLNGWYDMFGGFPQRWHTAVWHGYVYYAFEANVSPQEWPAIRQRAIDLCRERALVTEAYWRDEVVPELQGLYAELDRIDPSQTSGAELAHAWKSAWSLVERAWQLHMRMGLGPMQVAVDLREAYTAANPDEPVADAYRLTQGGDHEFFAMERDTEMLTETARGSAAVAGALRAGVRNLDDLRSQADGDAFASTVEVFLERHGHLGQAADDLTLPSFGEAPGLLLAAVAKRLDHPTEPVVERTARLARDADVLATATRARLAADPEALERFEATLAIAKTIGILADVHDYWIDRAVQAHLRRLVLRVGERLVRDGVIERPDDVFYVHRSEVPDLLRSPHDMRPVIGDRRDEHDRGRAMTPPDSIGRRSRRPPPIDRDPASAAPEERQEAILHGVGASPGIARGPARVVADVDEFERISAGDIIVSQHTNPSWIPVFAIAGGLVTELGGVTSHPAVVAREFGLAAVVGVRGATSRIADGQEIEIDGTAGTVSLIRSMDSRDRW